MGKKGTWYSAIKRLFTSHSKHKPLNEADNKSWKEKKRRFKHGSFIPLFREPSSIEEILEEIDQHNLFIGHHPTTQPQPQPQPQSQSPPQPQPQSQSPPQPQPQPQPDPQPQPQPQPHPQLQPSSSSGRPVSPPERLTPPPKNTSPPRVVHQQPKISHRPQPTLQQQHLSAIRIQAVYRGYMARRNVRGLTGLVRLQRVVTNQNVKRQTANAMKRMQLMVRVQTQIQSHRIQMLKNQALKPQPNNNNSHKQPETGDEFWDDSLITKEEREARLRRKEDAVIKRERAMSYAYSHQLWKETPKSAHQTLSLMGGYPYPWWWNWLERQLPYHSTPGPPPVKNAATPCRSTPRRTHNQVDTPTTPLSAPRSKRLIKYSRGASLYPMKDDDSLMSCPPFSVPNYMSPTVSARAKARAASNPKERWGTPATPGSESSKRRSSFPFTQNTNIKHKSPGSIGDLSMNSAISMPASVGRKPFNRFV